MQISDIYQDLKCPWGQRRTSWITYL